MTNSTNVTLQYAVSPTSTFNWAYTNVTWWPNQNPNDEYRAETNQYVNNGGTYTNVFIDYLDPSTSYSFNLIGWAYCIDNSGNYHFYYSSGSGASGSWTTSSDSMTKISGVVMDVYGTKAPSGIWLQAECVNVPSGDTSIPAQAETGTGGTFVFGTMPMYQQSYGDYPCNNGYEVDTAIGWSWQCAMLCAFQWGGTIFPNRWNETVYFYQPQWITFKLSPGVLSWDPAVFEFDSSASAFPEFNFSSSTTVTSSSSTSYAGFGSSSSEGYTISQSTGGPVGAGVEVDQEFQTTGRIVFNGMTNRTPWLGSVQYWGPEQSSWVGAPSISDWATVGQYSASNCAFWNQWVERGYHTTDSMTLTGTVTNTAGLSVSLSVSVSVTGWGVGGSFGAAIPLSYGTTLSSSSSNSASVFIGIPSNAQYLWYEFDACFQGNSNVSSGLVIHFWQVAATNTH